jgi:hypothetical protein
MAAFDTPGKVVTMAKTLAQDDDGVRYSETKYYEALNAGLAEAFRLRPDFFRGDAAPPFYLPADASGVLNWPPEYGFALVVFMTGYVEMIDSEGNEDARAVTFQNAFINKLRAA